MSPNPAGASRPRPVPRPRRGRENTRGWWGILRACLVVTGLAVAASTAVCALVAGAAAAGSAVLGGGLVVALSAGTLAVTAWAWDHAREQAIPLTLGAFVLKLILFGVLLGVVPTPGWVMAVPAGVSALVAVVVWQGAEMTVFSRTRRRIYD